MDLDYEKFKKWIVANKQRFFIGGSFVVVFTVGFGTGRYIPMRTVSNNQTHYTINSQKKPFLDTHSPEAIDEPSVKPLAKVGDTSTFSKSKIRTSTATSSADSQNSPCVVKGNISSGGRKIYHVKGGAFYNRVKPEQCFETEDEALAAGFIKSGR